MPDRPNAFDDDEPSPLGAPTPLAAGPTRRERRDRGDGDGGDGDGGAGRRSRVPLRVTVVAGIIVVVLLAFVPAIATAFQKTPRDRVGISYGGGPFEGSHFQKIVQPGSSLFFNGIFDDLYLYPADQQSYLVSKSSNENDRNSDSIIATSRDQVRIEFQVATYFKLNTDRLQDFHEQIGLRYAAYTNGGWDDMIRSTFRPQLENAIQQEARLYDVAEVFSSEEVLRTLQNDVQQTLTERLEAALGQQFFCGPTFSEGGECAEVVFVIKKIEIPESVVQAFERNRTSEIEVLTKQNEIAQRAAEAESIQQLANVGIDGEDYVLIKAIESGQVKFWVVPSDSGLSLQTGGAGGEAPSEPGG